MSNQIKGSLLTLLAGLFWGLSGVSGQFLMEQGVHVNLLTSFRLLIAGSVLVGLALWREPQKVSLLLKDKKNLSSLFLFSLFGLVLNQLAYLQSIHYTDAGTATVLQYIAPVILLVLVCLRTRRLPKLYDVTAIFLAISGTVVMATHGELTSLSMTPLGLFWGIFSAFTYVAYMVLPIKLIRQWGSLAVIGVSMLLGGLVFPLVTQAWQYSAYLSLSTLPAYFGIIGIGTILAYTLFLKGVSLVGPVKGSLLASVEPVAAVVFAVILLKEQFYLVDLFGMGLIIAAVLLISWRDLSRQD